MRDYAHIKKTPQILWRCFLVICVTVAAANFQQQGLSFATDLENSRNKKTSPLGAITIDDQKMSFSIPGTIIRTEAPLEFLAVTKGGNKGYESLIELETDAIKFNTACLLIGLDPKKAGPAKFHFDPNPMSGDSVNIVVSWQGKDEMVIVPASKLLAVDAVEVVNHNWVYTGSIFSESGDYLAQVDGTLIGFVHDPASIIEHKSGFGLSDYGAVSANGNICPPVKTKVVVTISRGKP